MKEYSYRVTDYGTNAALSFYIVLTQSIGLYKIYSTLQFDFIFFILLTEALNHIFHHPYF